MREAIQGTQVAIKAPHGMEGQSSSHQRTIIISSEGNRWQSSDSPQRAIIISSEGQQSSSPSVAPARRRCVCRRAVDTARGRARCPPRRLARSAYGREACAPGSGASGGHFGASGGHPFNAPSCAREHTLRPAGPLRCQQRHSGAIECHQYAYDVVAQVMKGACRPHLGATHPIGAGTSTTIGVRLGHCHCADRR